MEKRTAEEDPSTSSGPAADAERKAEYKNGGKGRNMYEKDRTQIGKE
jgi:hypothetical protein